MLSAAYLWFVLSTSNVIVENFIIDEGVGLAPVLSCRRTQSRGQNWDASD